MVFSRLQLFRPYGPASTGQQIKLDYLVFILIQLPFLSELGHSL